MTRPNVPAEHPLLGPLADDYRREGHWSDETVADAFLSRRAAGPDAPAIAGDEPLTRAELEDRARRLAGHLANGGLEPGDVLMAALAYDTAAVVVTLAASLLGLQLLGVARELPPARILRLHDLAKPGAVIVDRGRHTGPDRAALDGLLASHTGGGFLIADEDAMPEGATRLRAACTDGVRFEDNCGVAGACSVLIATGGTTGEPKLVRQHDNALLYSARQSVRCADIGAGDVYLGVGPFGHIMTYFATYIALDSGAALAPCAGWRRGVDAASVARLSRPTVSMMTSTHAYDLLQLGEDEAVDLMSLTRIMSAGKPDEFFADIERRYDLQMLRLYGLSEVGTHVHVSLADKIAAEADGRPTPGTDARIVDPGTGLPVGAGVAGEYQVRGPSMCLGYFERDNATADALSDDGYWKTGDLATIDAAGFVRICGRISDSIRRGGINISPDEMETLLFAHPDVVEGCLVGSPDPRLGQLVNAVVVPRSGVTVELEEIRGYLRSNGVPKKELPDRVIMIDAIPRTDLGRLSKRHLVDQLTAAGQL